MGLKNLFSRKSNNTEQHMTTQNNVANVTNSTNTTPLLEKVFKKLDVNGDVMISPTKLGSIMGSLSGLPEDELEELITEVNGDGDGLISLKEFVESNANGIDPVELMQDLKDAFDVFDVDKNGSITADKLRNVLGSLGEECSIEDCMKMIEVFDQDGDGVINFEEFKVMMMNSKI